MIKKGYDTKDIIELTGLTQNQINELRKLPHPCLFTTTHKAFPGTRNN